MGVQGRGTGRSIFRLTEQSFEFLIFLFSICILWVKRLRKSTPAHIAGKDLLFLRRGGTIFRFQLLQSADGRQIPAIFGFGPALAQMVVGDVEVFSVKRRCLSWLLLGQGKFFFGQRIQQGLYRRIVLNRKNDFYVPVFLRKLSEINALGLQLRAKPIKVRLRNDSCQIGQSQDAVYMRCSSAPISTCWHVQDGLSKNLRSPDKGVLCPFGPLGADYRESESRKGSGKAAFAYRFVNCNEISVINQRFL